MVPFRPNRYRSFSHTHSFVRWIWGSLSIVLIAATSSLSNDERQASGTTMDANGKPLPGVLLVWEGRVNDEQTVLQTTSDKDGRFQLSLPSRGTEEFEMFHVWAYKHGFPVRTVGLGSKFRQQDKIKDLEIRLPEKQSFDYQICNPDGSPFANQRVVTYSVDIPNGVPVADQPTGLVGLVPELIREKTQLKTNGDGEISIDCFSRILTRSFLVENEIVGQQQVRLTKDSRKSKLNPVGSVEGQILAKDPKPYAGMAIRFTTDHRQSRVSGMANVKVDGDGKFKVPALAIGSLNVYVDWDPDLHIYPLRLPDKPTIERSETFVIRSQPEPVQMVDVQGRVITVDSEYSVEHASISIGDARGRFAGMFKTDMAGNFNGRVCEGKVRFQVISLGANRLELYRNYNYPDSIEIEIPAGDDEPYQLPDLVLSKKLVVKGKLLDETGQPAGNRSIVLARGAFGHIHGKATTDENGLFEMKVSIREFNLNESWGPFFALHEKRAEYGKLANHLKLKLIDSDPEKLVLQIDAKSKGGN